MREAAIALGKAPFLGTLRPQLGEGVRSVTKDRAVFYFELDEKPRVARILAISFGGQDHQRVMLARLLDDQ